MENKAGDFVECLLFDLFESFCKARNLDLGLSKKFQPERCVPKHFWCFLVSFSKVFIDELVADIRKLPVLLCWSDDLFKRFTNSVCLKLIHNVDPEVGFLKVIAFLIVVLATSFLHKCYRWVDEVPKILETLLKEHIKTKFYEEDKFEEISSLSDRLEKDGDWCKLTVEEMRTCIDDSIKTELAATKRPSFDDLFDERAKTEIKDPKLLEKRLSPNDKNCPYCAIHCFALLRAFFKPRIMYKPERKQRQ